MLFELETIDAQRHRNIPMPHLSSYTKQTQVRIRRNINAYYFSGNLLNAFFFGAPLDNLQLFRQFTVSFIISTYSAPPPLSPVAARMSPHFTHTHTECFT